MKLTILLFSCAFLHAACIQVSGDRILARDLSSAIPEFGSVDPAQVVGYAPGPGAQRTISLGELGRLAKRFGVSVDLIKVGAPCFEQITSGIGAEEFQSAVTAALQTSGAHAEVLDFSRSPLPVGKLDFSMNGAAHPPAGTPDAPFMWRGRLMSESGRSFPVWAKVKVTAEATVVIALEPLSKGQTIKPEQVELRAVKVSPFTSGLFSELGQAAGRKLKRDIAAGQPIPAAALEEVKEVLAGDTVHVDAISGQADISFDAKAQASGRKGDTVLILNPANGRTFRAIVIEKNRVQAQISQTH